MKATELQLGNIVTVYPSMMPITIAAIHKGKVGYHSVPNKLEWVRIGLIRPIPLTPEILKKNEFEQIYDEYSVFYYDKFEIRERELTAEGLCEFELRIGGVLVFIHYIHELQHILRICELDELADNFKI